MNVPVPRIGDHDVLVRKAHIIQTTSTESDCTVDQNQSLRGVCHGMIYLVALINTNAKPRDKDLHIHEGDLPKEFPARVRVDCIAMYSAD